MSIPPPTRSSHGEGACQILWGFMTSLWLFTLFFPKVRFFSLRFQTLCILLLLFIFTSPVVEWLNHLKTQSRSEVKEVKRQETWNTALSRAKLMHAWLIWNYDNELFMTVIIIKNSILFQGSKKRTEFLWTSKVQFSSRKGQVWFCSLN